MELEVEYLHMNNSLLVNIEVPIPLLLQLTMNILVFSNMPCNIYSVLHKVNQDHYMKDII